MWPDRVSNPGPPTYESDALPIALRGPAGAKGTLAPRSNLEGGAGPLPPPLFLRLCVCVCLGEGLTCNFK